METWALIYFAGAAWIAQIALGWVQIRRFNHALSLLAANGRLRIGRSSGRFTPRVVLVLSLDEQNRITDNFVMKGLTVFSRPQSDARLTGLYADNLQPELLFPDSKPTRQALVLAISNI